MNDSSPDAQIHRREVLVIYERRCLGDPSVRERLETVRRTSGHNITYVALLDMVEGVHRPRMEFDGFAAIILHDSIGFGEPGTLDALRDALRGAECPRILGIGEGVSAEEAGGWIGRLRANYALVSEAGKWGNLPVERVLEGCETDTLIGALPLSKGETAPFATPADWYYARIQRWSSPNVVAEEGELRDLRAKVENFRGMISRRDEKIRKLEKRLERVQRRRISLKGLLTGKRKGDAP